LFSHIEIKLNIARGIPIDQHWIAVRFCIAKYGASGDDLETFHIEHPRRQRKGLWSV
jgi:hypothetical protein